jgi:hypothetical protein
MAATLECSRCIFLEFGRAAALAFKATAVYTTVYQIKEKTLLFSQIPSNKMYIIAKAHYVRHIM